MKGLNFLMMYCQAALSKEKSERARIVLALRDTITGLKQAGDVEGRLKADLVQTHENLATSRAAQVSSFCDHIRRSQLFVGSQLK